jgi:PhnB protein
VPIPEGYHTVTPWIVTRDTARLLDFLADAFDAVEIARVSNEDGSIGHAESRIGDSVVMMFDAKPEWPDTPAFLRLYVDDGDAVYERAIAAGGSPVTAMTEMFWGDRVGRVRDPLGNVWWIQCQIAALTAEEIERRAGQPEFLEAMAYVQGAEIVRPIN